MRKHGGNVGKVVKQVREWAEDPNAELNEVFEKVERKETITADDLAVLKRKDPGGKVSVEEELKGIGYRWNPETHGFDWRDPNAAEERKSTETKAEERAQTREEAPASVPAQADTKTQAEPTKPPEAAQKPSGEGTAIKAEGAATARDAAYKKWLHGLEDTPERRAEFERKQQKTQEKGRTESKEDRIQHEREDLSKCLDALKNGREDEISGYRNRHFQIARTTQQMKDAGLKGDVFTVRFGVIARHLGKDAEHNLGRDEWADIAANINDPIAITRYGKDGFRLWTRAKIDGKNIIVGVNVKNAGRELTVNSIETAFGANGAVFDAEKLVYPATTDKISLEDLSVLTGHNSRTYTNPRRTGNSIAKTDTVAQPTAAKKSAPSAKSSGDTAPAPTAKPISERIAAQEKKKAEREEIAKRLAAPLKGGIGDLGQMNFGFEGAPQDDLFSAALAAKPSTVKPATKSPAVKMKDAESERKAQKLEDELAALFDSPEYDPQSVLTEKNRNGIISQKARVREFVDGLVSGKIRYPRFTKDEAKALQGEENERLARYILALEESKIRQVPSVQLHLESAESNTRTNQGSTRVVRRDSAKRNNPFGAWTGIVSNHSGDPRESDASSTYLDRGVESVVYDKRDGYVQKVRQVRAQTANDALDILSGIVYHNYLFPKDAYILDDILNAEWGSGQRGTFLILRQKLVTPLTDSNGHIVSPTTDQIVAALRNGPQKFTTRFAEPKVFDEDDFWDSSSSDGEDVPAAKDIAYNDQFAVYDFQPGRNTFIDSKTGEIRFIDPRVNLNDPSMGFDYSRVGKRKTYTGGLDFGQGILFDSPEYDVDTITPQKYTYAHLTSLPNIKMPKANKVLRIDDSSIPDLVGMGIKDVRQSGGRIDDSGRLTIDIPNFGDVIVGKRAIRESIKHYRAIDELTASTIPVIGQVLKSAVPLNEKTPDGTDNAKKYHVLLSCVGLDNAIHPVIIHVGESETGQGSEVKSISSLKTVKTKDALSRRPFKAHKDQSSNSTSLDEISISNLLDSGKESIAPYLTNDVATHLGLKRNNVSKGILFDSPELDPEMLQKRVGALARLAKTYLDSGVASFETLASRLHDRFPDKFGSMKPYLRGLWNMVAEQMDLEEVSKAEAQAVFAGLEQNGIIDTQGKEQTDGNAMGAARRSRGHSGGTHDGMAAETGDKSDDGEKTGKDGSRKSENLPSDRLSGRSGLGGLRVGDRTRGDSSGSTQGGRRSEGSRDNSEDGKGSSGRTARSDRHGTESDESRLGVESKKQGDLGRGESAGSASDPAAVNNTAHAAVEEKSPTKTAPKNYAITDADEAAINSAKPIDRVRGNIEAIKILRSMQETGREATPEEKTKLARFVGWGGCADVFDYWYELAYNQERRGEKVEGYYARNLEATKFGRKGYELYKELRDLMSDDEIARAKESALTAYYTPISLVRDIHAALANAGVTGGRFLETSAGVGGFIGTTRGYEKGVNWTAVELDPISGGILQALYPQSSSFVTGFEKVSLPNNFFDAVISNFPYGNFSLHDPAYNKYKFPIHDYFFAKSLDKLRVGGVMAALTSTGTLDKANKKLIAWLSDHGGKIVAAVRLPNGTFKNNAGTDVACDVVFIQKVDGEADNSAFEKNGAIDGIPINQYFIDNPDMLAAIPTRTSGRFGETLRLEDKPGVDIAKTLADAAAKLSFTESTNTPETKAQREAEVDADGIPEGRLVVRGNAVFRKEQGVLVPVTDVKSTKELPFPEVVKAMGKLIEARDALVKGMTENCTDERLKELQKTLNDVYDDFVRRFGHLNETKVYKMLINDWHSGIQLSALENEVKKDGKPVEYRKADIFTKRVVSPAGSVNKVDGAVDGLRVSLNATGSVDIPLIARISGMTEEDAAKELLDSGLVFLNPDGNEYETRGEYLSGSVRHKLVAAESAAKLDPKFQRNVEALRAVIPANIPIESIALRLGQSWIPVERYNEFIANEIFGGNTNWGRVHYNELDKAWVVEARKNLTSNYDNSLMDVDDIIERTMNGKAIKVYVKDNGASVFSPIETKKAVAVQLQVEKAFVEWAKADDARAKELAEIYNFALNDNVPREWDTNLLSYDGLSDEWRKNLDTPGREYQKRAIARGVFGGNLLLAHTVGAGKTVEMAAIAMELRRLGIAKKPMFVVPNHMLKQWSTEFVQTYPLAKVLMATPNDLSKDNRRKFMARIANGDWDAVVIAHSSFGSIGMADEYVTAYINKEIRDLENAIQGARESGQNRRSVKQLENKKKNLEEKLKKLLAESKKDVGVKFNELGVDYLFVDEAHNFKGIAINTHMNTVPGIGGTTSQKAQDMEMKCQFVRSLHSGDRGVVFATGTPISNSVSEMYVMMRYLAPQKMEEMGIRSFDDWARQFGDIVTAFEMNPSGVGWRDKSRFARFVNVPELTQFFRSFADVVMSKDLNIQRPALKGGKKTIHEIEPTEKQKAYIRSLDERAKRLQNGNVDPSEDNMLRITHEGRLLAIDPRLVGVDDDSAERLRVCADEVARIYDATTNGMIEDKDGNLVQHKGTQLIFCDSGVPKKKSASKKKVEASKNDESGDDASSGDDSITQMLQGRFDMYNAIKEKLVARGIPANEIAFIHDYPKPEQKQKLFEAVRNGDIRVLIGNTPKMGEGTNVQKRLVALHHLDVPWKPAWVEQRDGRIIRSGNLNKEVEIHQYVTKGTFDVYSWQTITRKAKFIEQALSGGDARIVEDVDSAVMTAEEVMAAATGDPRVMTKLQLRREIDNMKDEASVAIEQKADAIRRVSEAEAATAKALRDTERQRTEITKFNTDRAGREFAIETLDGKTLSTNDEIVEHLNKKVNEAIQKGADALILGKLFGRDILWRHLRGFPSAVGLDGFNNNARINLDYYWLTTSFTKNDLTKLKTKITNATGEKAIATLDQIVTNAQNYEESAKRSLENLKSSVELMPEIDRKAKELYQLDIDLGLNQDTSHFGNVYKDDFDFAVKNAVNNGELSTSKESKSLSLPDGFDGATREALGGNENFTVTTNNGKKYYALGEAPVPVAPKTEDKEEQSDSISFDSPEFDVERAERIEEVSRKFDDDLQKQIDGTLPKDYIYNLGKPGAVLRSTGVPDLPIELSASKLEEKSKHYRHPFNIAEIKGLVRAIQRPVGVFAYGDKTKAQNLVVDITSNDKNYIVGLSLAPTVNGGKLSINSVRNVFPKDNHEWLNWITQGKALYLDKAKIQTLINQQRMNFADVEYLDLDSAESITNSFENPQEGIYFDSPEFDVNTFGIDNEAMRKRMEMSGLKIKVKKSVRHMEEVVAKADALLAQDNGAFLDKTIQSLDNQGAKPRPATDAETVAIGKRVEQLARAYDVIHSDVIEIENAIEMDPNLKSDADLMKSLRELREKRNAAQAKYEQAVRVQIRVGSEQGRALNARKTLFDAEKFTYLGMKQTQEEILGRPLTEEEANRLHKLVDNAKNLTDEAKQLYYEQLESISQTIIDGVKKQVEGRRRYEANEGRFHRRALKKYNDAVNQLMVWSQVGDGSITGLVGSSYQLHNKILKDMLEFIAADNPGISYDDAINRLVDEVNNYVEADKEDVLRLLTGFEKSWDPTFGNEAKQTARDWRSQALVDLQIEKLERGEMPGITGAIPTEPSEELREKRRIRDDLKSSLLEKRNDPRLLKNRLDFAKTWYQNRIKDLEWEIEHNQRIEKKERKPLDDYELAQLKLQYAKLKDERDALLGKKVPTIEELTARYEKTLARTLEHAQQRLERAYSGDFKKPERRQYSSDKIDALKKQINDTNREYNELRMVKLFRGKTPEEIAAINERRIKARQEKIERLKKILSGEIEDKPAAKPQPWPMTDEQKAIYERQEKQMRKLREQLVIMRQQAMLDRMPPIGKALKKIEAILTVPRILKSTADLSSMGIQASMATIAHPVMAKKAFMGAIRSMFSQENCDIIWAEIISDPDYYESKKAGVEYHKVSDAEGHMLDVPEAFAGFDTPIYKGKSIQDAPVVGKIIKGSNRGWSNYLNIMKFLMWKSLKTGSNWDVKGPTQQQMKDIAGVINAATGIGYQNGSKSAIDTVVRMFMWAPRLTAAGARIASGYDIFAPLSGWAFGKGAKGNHTGDLAYANFGEAWASSKMAMKQTALMYGAAAFVTVLFTVLFGEKDPDYLMDAIDPRSSEFGNVKIGNRRVNFLGPVRQWLQFAARIVTGENKRYGVVSKQTIEKVLGRFLRSKASPIAGVAWSALEGKDYVGDEYGWLKAVKDLTLPLSPLASFEGFENDSALTAAALIPLVMTGYGKAYYPVDKYHLATDAFFRDSNRVKKLQKEGKWKEAQELRKSNPLFKVEGQLLGLRKAIANYEKLVASYEKDGKPIPKWLTDKLEEAKQRAITLAKESR